MYVLFVPAGLFASYIDEIPQLGQVILGEFNNWQAMRGVQSTELVLDFVTLYVLYRVVRKQGDHLTGLTVVGVICILTLMVMVQPVDEAESPMGAFIDDTIAQQQFKAGYGNSHLSFWGQYPKLAAWGKPGAGMLYCLSCLLLGFFPRRMGFERLLALSAAVLVGTQLVLSFAGGTYIGFYLAPVILTFFVFKQREEA